MYAARAARPKLSLSISAVQGASQSLRSPGLASAMPRTPVSPSPMSPANSREYATLQPSYSYTNSSSAKGILKKHSQQSSSTGASKKIQFQNTPTVYCVTPIENKDEYYGGYVKMSRDERRWAMHT
ncbi:hypothetical protein T310_0981 [Rasamsonia emersonii CBS 393.64]|uniref:Uncharacterized protein n=1 Tax=Rasamsonia emersonii (strain ATCC 16479 / CBS 393.64 / IMI 116815) TaxID=1408163 RepID=A0A0F4Z3S0_RASE3|nr:hypothetical protein T310_0981 [Rasamsonia emersonii CBS 393.64]KKA25000.1 hypothetical protein T310_0981 [Rasamsonia emersonii CBS 393.64]